MKKRIFSTVLALVFAFTLIVSAAAAVPPENIQNGSPSGILLLDEDGYLMTDVFNKVIWHVHPDGTVNRTAGQINIADLTGEPVGLSSDGTVDTAFFTDPWDIAPFLDGYVVSDSEAHLIRYINGTIVQTAAGSGRAGRANGVGTQASFSRPTGLAAGDKGEVYIADTDNGFIRRLDPNGSVTTFFSGLSEPTGLCWHNGALYVAETGAHCISLIQDGKRTVLVGLEGQDGYTDGSVSAAKLRDPQGIVVGEDGALYIADTGNGAVRKVLDGMVTTLIHSEDEGAPVLPRSLAIQGDDLLVTDPFTRSIATISLAEKHFEDIYAGAWYESAVHLALRLGLVNGMGNNRFVPQGKVTRAQMTTMLANLQVCLDHDVIPFGEAELADVSEDAWYHGTARWAADLQLLPIEDACFRPKAELTREEMAIALFRFAQAMGVDTSARKDLSSFTDSDLIGDEAQEAFAWVCAAGLIRGVSDTQLAPGDSATRAQMVQVMIRFLNLIQSNS